MVIYIYEGDWRRGKRNGKGMINFSNGNRYEGQWRNNKISNLKIVLNNADK